ncbi:MULTISPECIES: zinc-dependent alcohol dehydrogenase [Thermoanaerobacterium]|uniref:Alcohol dehydrogenase n=2 Tax=Thermoanaerobacterium TaxID=28895 RepID=W9EF04_9THEO|nr:MULTISPECIES: alcohol dehydrogenase catalytic domain-containing protein [Thermoanaerobacterium]AFK85254.1 Alcohol dehydrogenase zinc-binding domain protein [Thermoanaerobacterium saccharolyticum JW/SL-YS485]ETO39826.1 alcohol dehydrogenase [Thermoanaerobacterium aotearoense SCUT27]
MEVNQIDIEEIVKKILNDLRNEPKENIKESNSKIPSICRAAVLTDVKKIEVKEFNIPEINDDEMLVKVEGCGVCGTDVHEYKGDPFGLIPLVLGHEGTGEIVKLGKNVRRDSAGKEIKEGDKIVTSVVPCGECDICLNHPDKTNLCENSKIYGLISDDNYHLNGWFSEYIVIRKGSTFYKVNDINLNLRLLVEPAAVVVHAVERAKSTGLMKFNSKVLVQGCGPIGLLLLSVVKTLGVENIIAVDGDENRLNMAKRLGATALINFTKYSNIDELVDAVKKASDGIGADFAFQCTGVPSAASNIWKFVRRGGGLCEVGFFVNNGDCKINPHYDICNKEITAVGSWTYTPQDYLTTFDFLKRAKEIGLPIEELITHRFSLDKMNEAMEVNMKQEGIKVVYINDRF